MDILTGTIFLFAGLEYHDTKVRINNNKAAKIESIESSIITYEIGRLSLRRQSQRQPILLITRIYE